MTVDTSTLVQSIVALGVSSTAGAAVSGFLSRKKTGGDAAEAVTRAATGLVKSSSEWREEVLEELRGNRAELKETREELQATREELHATKDQLAETQVSLNRTRDELHVTQKELVTAQAEIRRLQQREEPPRPPGGATPEGHH